MTLPSLKSVAKALYVAGLLTFSTASNATLTLSFNDGAGNSLSIADGSALDADTDAGSVAVNVGTSVGGWKVSGTAGLALTDPTGLHLNSFSVTKTTFGSGTLVITLQETGLTQSFTSLVSSVGGIVGGNFSSGDSAKFETFINNTLVSELGSYNGGAFQGIESVSYAGTGPYTLRQVASVTHTNSGQTSFDFETTVPEPASLALLGLGLLGIGFARRSKVA